MWHFEFDAPVNTRILRSHFVGITHFGAAQSDSFPKSWFDGNKWVDNPTGYASTLCRCGSFKAFKRHLRKHPELQGVDGYVVLVSRFVGHNIIARWV